MTPPAIVCTNSKLALTTPNINSSSVRYVAPNATDNVGVAALACTPQIGTLHFPVGLTPVNLSAKDLAGNTASCNFNMTVSDNQVWMAVMLESDCGAFGVM